MRVNNFDNGTYTDMYISDERRKDKKDLLMFLTFFRILYFTVELNQLYCTYLLKTFLLM